MKYVLIGKGCGKHGWTMSSEIYAKCPKCGYYMSLNPNADDECPCGNMSKDTGWGRFGAMTGDDSIELYRIDYEAKEGKP